MLMSLTYSNVFPSTGRTLEGSIQFQKGLGAIVGKNESGKSFIVEVLRFSLFGSAALRGRAEDYRKLTAELAFTVKGQAYRVIRTGLNAMLFRGTEEIAVGVRPVNSKIVQILGFGLEVFDVASVCNQGEIEKLGSMKPADRKRMVDSVVGLNVIEQLGRWASDEALGLTREADAIERTLVEPAKPVEPAGYRPSLELMVEAAQLQALQRELDGLEGWLSHRQSEPTKPQCDIAWTAAELRELMVEQMRKETEEAALKSRLARLPSPSPYSDVELHVMEAQHAALALWQERLRFERLHPGSAFSTDALSQMSADWLCLERHEELEAVEHRLSHADHHDCPKCRHRWPADPMSVARLMERRTELLALIDVLEASSWALKVPIALAMFAGLREGDALAIPRSAYDGAKLDFVTGKTGQRICWPVSSALKEVLVGAPIHEASTLAANSHGKTWTESGFRGSWRTLRVKLEQQGKVEPGLTIHGLRHTVATILREEGFDERTIADVLGQKTESMARHYARDADLSRKMAGVAERLEEAENRRRTKVVKPT